MTNFEINIKNRKVRIVQINLARVKSLIKSSQEAIANAQEISLKEGKQKTILRELYEGLRQFCEAIGYSQGYQFLDHESLTFFINDILRENFLASKFDRYRKIRNGINYYGNELELLIVKDALLEIPKMISLLKKHLKI
ncbi:MAG: hypothetical protein AABY06_04015 [Nanoarchaeota archaeon]